jgi:regulatory protein
VKITSIKQQVKNAERASFFVDGKYSFSLSLNELVTEKLKINQEVDQAEVKRLMRLSEDGKLKARALEWSLNHPRSVRECREYLYRKKAEPDQINRLVDDFLERGYLDDVAFAKWLIDMRKRGGKSDRAIQNELMKKGVGREIISEVLKKDTMQERELLKEVIEKKRRLSRYKNDEMKLKQYLMRQGFAYEDIKIVLSDAD